MKFEHRENNGLRFLKGVGEYLHWCEGTSHATLDGEFTARDLFQIARYMTHVMKERKARGIPHPESTR